MSPALPQRLPHRLRRATLLVSLVLAALPAAATPGVDEPPVPGAPRALALPDIHEDRLPNGLRLVVVPRPSVPLVSVVLHLAPGSSAEPAGRAGLSSLTAQLRLKGARVGGQALSASALAQRAEALGGALDAGASRGGLSTSMTVITPNVAQALTLVAAVVRDPLLAADELERLKAQTLDSLKIPLADPMQLASLAATQGAWGASVFGSQATPASVGRITLDEIRELQRRLAQPQQATLVMVGDITPAQARDLAQQTLGDWRGSDASPPSARREPPAPQTPRTVLVNLPGAGQSGVVVTAPGVATDSPERRAAQLATAVLGGGYSARLGAELRIKRGLTYGATAVHDSQASGGILKAAAQTKPSTAAELAQVTMDEMQRLGREAPGADELAARKASLIGGFSRQFDTTGGIAGIVISELERGRQLAQLRQVVPEIEAVSAEQVRDYAARHWQASQLRTVIVGDVAASGPTLKALDPQALSLEAAALDLESPTLKR
ncbi:insulinase family protein [Ideonella sp. 4Y11]|uniref:Insulinase family protein n=1 Tax=Ideonella aquatica TaxID=2824119 RepID=A0A941BK01_9BURK|nr:pitrilysin family protein [Ideonella aquatica]MBQ0960012.1 insulinase family protein [Ideonella aquatica]